MNPLRVAILDDYQRVATTSADWGKVADRVSVHSFHEHFPDDSALVEHLASFDAVVLMRERTALSGAVIRQLPRLRLIVTTAARNASLDVEAAASAGITVSGTRALVTPTVELTWALILALSRNIPREDASVRSGGWQTSVGYGLEGRVLGLLGLGMLGSRVARIARAFEMPVIAWSRNLTAERAAEAGATAVTRDELFQRSDVLSIHLRLSASTTGLVGTRELSLMKKDAMLINTSRSSIVNEAALVNALTEQRIGGAGLDVYDIEPLPSDHALLGLENTVLTPHIGFVTVQNYRLFFEDVIEDIEAFLAGRTLRPLETGFYRNESRAPLPTVNESMTGLA